MAVFKERGIGQVLPILCLGVQLPASVRTICGTLPTQRRHRAQAAYSFHSHPPCRFPHLIFCFCIGVIMIMTQNKLLRSLRQRRRGWLRIVSVRVHIGLQMSADRCSARPTETNAMVAPIHPKTMPVILERSARKQTSIAENVSNILADGSPQKGGCPPIRRLAQPVSTGAGTVRPARVSGRWLELKRGPPF